MNHHLALLTAASELTTANVTDELCCVFAHRQSELAFGVDAVKRAPLSLWMLYADCGDPWGTVTAVVLARLAVGPGGVHTNPQTCLLEAGHWYRCQGWRGVPFAPGVSGHTITVFAGPNDVAVVYDSAKDPRNFKATYVKWSDYVKQYVGGIAAARLVDP